MSNVYDDDDDGGGWIYVYLHRQICFVTEYYTFYRQMKALEK